MIPFVLLLVVIPACVFSMASSGSWGDDPDQFEYMDMETTQFVTRTVRDPDWGDCEVVDEENCVTHDPTGPTFESPQKVGSRFDAFRGGKPAGWLTRKRNSSQTARQAKRPYVVEDPSKASAGSNVPTSSSNPSTGSRKGLVKQYGARIPATTLLRNFNCSCTSGNCLRSFSVPKVQEERAAWGAKTAAEQNSHMAAQGKCLGKRVLWFVGNKSICSKAMQALYSVGPTRAHKWRKVVRGVKAPPAGTAGAAGRPTTAKTVAAR